MAKTAALRWEGALRFRADGSDAALVLDADEVGRRPTEMLLASLAACTGMDVISILQKKRQEVGAYRVRAAGEQREGHPAVFTSIVVEHEVEGEAVDPEAVRRSVELSATRYCPVTAQLSQGDVTIAHHYVVRRPSGELRGEVCTTGPHGRGLTRAS